MKKIIKYVIIDLLHNKIMLGYTLFLLLLSFGMFDLEDNASKGLLGLMNIVLIIVPLVSIIFSTIHLYNSAEFIELLLSQPLKRRTIWLGIFFGTAICMGLAFLIGAGVPILLFQANATGFTLLLVGVLLSVIFVAIAMVASVITRDKAKGIGVAIMLWLYFTLLFDALILFLLFQFSDRPIEKAMVGITALNPIDLGRILILLKMDISVLMGYTGAVFKEYFGTTWGMSVSLGVMMAWIALPLYWSLRRFNKKDI